ncbi:33014_t:CDS:2, partial [Gigaspora margarita]
TTSPLLAIATHGTTSSHGYGLRLRYSQPIESRKMGRINNFWLRSLPGLKGNNIKENEKINAKNIFLSCNLSCDGVQFAGTSNVIQGHKQPYKIHEQSDVEEPLFRLRKRNHSINYAESSSRKKTDSDNEEKSKRVTLASVIVLIRPCPYSTFTSYEWKQIVNTNPYIVKESVWTNPFASSLSEACNNIAIGLDNNFVSNNRSDLGKKASWVFNNLKEDLPSVQTKRTMENEHRFNYLDPLLRPFFCGDSKDYEIKIDKSVNGLLKRPDFSCKINDITILNSEIKPLGCTEFQKNKDFVKAHLRSKRSINQLLNEGGPNQSVIFLNMGDDVNSYVMDLQYD